MLYFTVSRSARVSPGTVCDSRSSGTVADYCKGVGTNMTSLVTLACILCACVLVRSEVTVIDLTHTLGPRSEGYPGNPKLNFTNIRRGEGYLGIWQEMNWFSVAEHIGTHFDAPRHFCVDAWKAHEIPIQRLVGPAVVINLTAEAASNIDFGVTNETLIAWENDNVPIPDKAFLFFEFGWARRYPNWHRMFNPRQRGRVQEIHYPGLAHSAVEWLVANRNVHAVGVDTPSPDLGVSKTFIVHRMLCENEVVILENVANLDQMPPYGAMAYGGAVKLRDGSGGPVRLFATVDNSAGVFSFSAVLLTLIICFHLA
ncbi:isatin hydrolase-like [Gigantopelta aegis]|uniref:isatin hydrolase-like n=1 Tax=Gigantopelta aegis TaxID=1735272 RepID=UPI001B88C093|nr:isatin hydrolase-like [Gigantopelta aegis]